MKIQFVKKIHQNNQQKNHREFCSIYLWKIVQCTNQLSQRMMSVSLILIFIGLKTLNGCTPDHLKVLVVVAAWLEIPSNQRVCDKILQSLLLHIKQAHSKLGSLWLLQKKDLRRFKEWITRWKSNYICSNRHNWLKHNVPSNNQRNVINCPIEYSLWIKVWKCRIHSNKDLSLTQPEKKLKCRSMYSDVRTFWTMHMARFTTIICNWLP